MHNNCKRNGNVVCYVCTGTPDHLILNIRTIIWSCSLHCCYYNSFHSSRKDFHVSVEIFAHSSSRAFLRSGTDVGWEGLVCNLYSSSFQSSSMRALKFFHTKLIQSCLYGPWCTVMLEYKWAFPKLFPQRWKHSKMVWYVKTLSFLITVCKGPALNPKKQSYTIILHQILQLEQCSQTGNILPSSAKSRLAHQTAK